MPLNTNSLKLAIYHIRKNLTIEIWLPNKNHCKPLNTLEYSLKNDNNDNDDNSNPVRDSSLYFPNMNTIRCIGRVDVPFAREGHQCIEIAVHRWCAPDGHSALRVSKLCLHLHLNH